MTWTLPYASGVLTIREFSEGDAQALAEIEFSSHVKEYLSIPNKAKSEWISRFDPNTLYGWAVDLDGVLVGRCSLERYRSTRKGYGEIAIVLSESFSGRGLGIAVTEWLICRAKEINARGIVAIVDPRNLASIRLVKRFGFRHRGVVSASSIDWQIGHIIYRLPIKK